MRCGFTADKPFDSPDLARGFRMKADENFKTTLETFDVKDYPDGCGYFLQFVGQDTNVAAGGSSSSTGAQ